MGYDACLVCPPYYYPLSQDAVYDFFKTVCDGAGDFPVIGYHVPFFTTGIDIPTFEKTTTNEATEEELLYSWVKSLPENYAKEMLNLYDEMAKRETVEAKVYKAIDSLEALVQHNISDLSTWIPKEYELNKTYADDKVAFSEYLKELREEIRKDTLEKLGE